MTDPLATPAPTGAEARPHWKRDVVVFLGGQTFSLFGSMLVQYAVMWHLTLETKSGVVMAMAAVFGFLPQAIVSVFGGVWADRLNRKALIIAADGSIAVTTLALALLMMNGVTELWLIFLTLSIRSAGAGIQMPAVSALIPQITPEKHLMRVNGINGSIQSAMMLLAPAAAGALYASASLVSIFFVDVITAAIGIAMLLSIAVPTIRRGSEQAVGYFADLAAGVKYTFSHRLVRWLLILFAIIFVLTVAPSTLTPLMVARTFGDDVWMLTVLEISFSVGMVAGGIVIAVWGGTKNKILMVVAASLVFGFLAIGLGFSTNLWVFFGFMLLTGLAVPFFSTPSMTVLQERVEPEMQGRVFGFVGIVMAVAMPFGMVIFGPLADQFTVESILVVSGIITFIVIAVAVLIPSGRAAIRAGAEQPAVEPADQDAPTT